MIRTIFKNKLLMMAIITVLVTGLILTTTFNDVEAKKSTHILTDESTLKIKQSTVTCTDQDGFCGEGKLRAKLHLISTGIEGNVITGNAKGVIQGSGWGWLISETSSSTKTELRNDGPLSYDYHTGTRILTMTGNLVDENSLGYSFDAIGDISAPKNDKAKIDFTIRLVNENGIVIDATGTGIIIDASSAGIKEGIKIKSNGDATCQTSTGGDCGTGLLKSKVRLLEQETNGDSSTGIGKIKTTMSSTDGWDFELELRSKSLSYQYDELGNVISIQGDAKDSNGNTWQLEMNVNSVDLVEKTGDCSLRYSNLDGTVIEQPSAPCGVVLVPIDR